MSNEGPFKEGQIVRVAFEARVAEVGSGRFDRSTVILRVEDGPLPVGWIDTSLDGLDIDIISDGSRLPTQPGMYWSAAKNPEEQMHMGNFHTDGKEFYYLNASSEWVDVGFGFPFEDRTLIPLVEVPF